MNTDFEKVYNDTVLPKLTELEPERKKLLKNMLLKEIGLIALFIISFVFMCNFIIMALKVFDNGNSPIKGTLIILTAFTLLPAIIILCGAEIYLIPKKTTDKFKKLIKSGCMKMLTASAGELVWTGSDPKKNLPLASSDLFPMHNDIKYDDTFNGIYQDSEFYIQEIELIFEGSKEKSKRFNGIVICIPSNKTVKAQTIITSKFDLNIQNRMMTKYTMLIIGLFFITLGLSPFIFHVQINGIFEILKVFFCCSMTVLAGFGFIYMAYQQHKQENEYKKITLEDLNFDKRFNVLSKDQIEARYLITTAFMDRLQNFQTAFGTDNIKCSFFDDKIMFAISTNKDLFEIGNLFVPLTHKRQIEIFYKEIISIYDMIDYFKLAQKTGL